MNAGIDGELVRKLRTAKSWSQEELGQISGLSERTVQRIETEDSGSLDSRRALASAFGLKPEDLLPTPARDTSAPDADNTFMDQPNLGVVYGAILWFAMGASLLLMLVSIAAFAVEIGTRRSAPMSPMWMWFGGQLLFGVTAYFLWLTANTSYQLSSQGLQVRFGPYRRIYRWDDFAMAYWRRGMVPVRFTLFQPVTRLSDVVTLEARAGGSGLDLTPKDSQDFMRRLAALAPQLVQAGNR